MYGHRHTSDTRADRGLFLTGLASAIFLALTVGLMGSW
jgi:hypothetical protein